MGGGDEDGSEAGSGDQDSSKQAAAVSTLSMSDDGGQIVDEPCTDPSASPA